MKLRNFMYATMIACAFASCSKDDVIENGTDPVAKGDANLTIVVDALNMGTKAVKPTGTTSNTLEGETDIKTLTLVVFNSTGSYLASATGGTDGKVSIEGLAPQEIKFMVFANMSISNISNLSSSTIYSQPLLLDGTNGFTVGAGLPMSSNLVESITLVSGNNYYGYNADEMSNPATNGQFSVGIPLPLIRNVARVDLEAVKLSMADSDYATGSASFQYSGAYIENAANKALTNGSVASDATFVTGTAAAYTYYANLITALTSKTQNFTATTTREDAEDVMAEKAYYYILTNTQVGANATPTKLVVRGNFSLTNATKKGDTSGKTYTLASQEGFYPITVGVDGLPSGTAAGLERNKIYKITLLVAGPGRSGDGGGRAAFFVKCAVADWTTVDQIHPVQ